MKARLLWVLPLALVGSWLMVRTLAASTVAETHAAPVLVTAVASVPHAQPEIKDAALARMIDRFATQARRR